MVIYDCTSKEFLYIACKGNNESTGMMGPMISPKKLQNKFTEFSEKFFGEAAVGHSTHNINQGTNFKSENIIFF
jgi:hypothetical protein